VEHKKIIFVILVLIISVNCKAITWTKLVYSIAKIESNQNSKAIGKHNDVGFLQLTPVYVKEVNRICGKRKYTLRDRYSIRKSIEMFNIYQSHYNPHHLIKKAIRLHNPKASTKYMNKILALL
jgi:hypothetical protein